MKATFGRARPMCASRCRGSKRSRCGGRMMGRGGTTRRHHGAARYSPRVVVEPARTGPDGAVAVLARRRNVDQQHRHDPCTPRVGDVDDLAAPASSARWARRRGTHRRRNRSPPRPTDRASPRISVRPGRPAARGGAREGAMALRRAGDVVRLFLRPSGMFFMREAVREFPVPVQRRAGDRLGRSVIARAVDRERGGDGKVVEHELQACARSRRGCRIRARPQLGMSGVGTPPAGGVKTVRRIAGAGPNVLTLNDHTRTGEPFPSGSGQVATLRDRRVGRCARYGSMASLARPGRW